MQIDILSLFPKYFQGPFDESIVKRARASGVVDIRLHDIRDFAEGSYRQVDDRPYGGGPGMVMMVPPIVGAIRSVKTECSKVLYLSPQGKSLTAEKCKELSKQDHLVLLCGHYEGVDQRIIDSEVDEEISIGDYVLSNGCLAAIVLVDATLRFVPGVIGHNKAAEEDSFQDGILDWPHYTRPLIFEGMTVPRVLLGGHHKEIEKWRYEQALKKTRRVRPDLFSKHLELMDSDDNDGYF